MGAAVVVDEAGVALETEKPVNEKGDFGALSAAVEVGFENKDSG